MRDIIDLSNRFDGAGFFREADTLDRSLRKEAIAPALAYAAQAARYLWGIWKAYSFLKPKLTQLSQVFQKLKIEVGRDKKDVAGLTELLQDGISIWGDIKGNKDLQALKKAPEALKKLKEAKQAMPKTGKAEFALLATALDDLGFHADADMLDTHLQKTSALEFLTPAGMEQITMVLENVVDVYDFLSSNANEITNAMNHLKKLADNPEGHLEALESSLETGELIEKVVTQVSKGAAWKGTAVIADLVRGLKSLL